MTKQRGPGRACAQNVAHRRIQAEQYLVENFPRSATFWSQLRSNQLSTAEFANAVAQMIAEAKSADPTELVGERDKFTLNPEQAVARVLKRVAAREKMIVACQAELSALDTVRAAIEQVLAAHRDAGRVDTAEITAAAAQQPTMDREVTRRAFDILCAGVSRADVIREKQIADKLWSSPRNWASLPETTGRFTITDRPPSGGIDQELLPPSASIAHYFRDPSKLRDLRSGATAAQLIKATETELKTWILLHYPGPTARQPAVMAAAWASLILLSDPTFQQSDHQVDVLMPSVWKPGRVMRIRSN